MDAYHPRVSRTAYLLGYAGLLPQIAAVVLVALFPRSPDTLHYWLLGLGIALVYGTLILSFLGGVWWGFAMRRSKGQPQLGGIAVLPSLAALPLVIWTMSYGLQASAWPLVLLGVLIIATLTIDRHLAATRDAPPDWMRLRAPLSLGLGGLTILAGLLAA